MSPRDHGDGGALHPQGPVAAGRSYVLHLVIDGDAVRASVQRHGPDALTRAGIGLPANVAPALAGRLFALCPYAQSGAAAAAIEDAWGVSLHPAQAAARTALIAAEAVAAAVWRAGLTWPALEGRAPHADPVRQARAAVDALAAALYAPAPQSTQPWAHPGGADLALNPAEASGAVRDLSEALQAVAPHHECAHEAALAAGLEPVLAARFPAWSAHAQAQREALVSNLEITFTHASAPPTTAPQMQSGTQTGEGWAQTARGPLRHQVSLSEGRVHTWTASAPTDAHFAPDGPVAAHAARLMPGPQLARTAAWLVAAFDPCAPCAVHMHPAGGGHA